MRTGVGFATDVLATIAIITVACAAPATRAETQPGAEHAAKAAGLVAATSERSDCTAIEETDFERVVQCMSLEELAGQLTAFNELVSLRLTGKTLEQNVDAGLGTIMGITLDPRRIHKLQRLAQNYGHPPLLFFEDTERGARTILPSSLAQSFTWNLDLVETGARMAARESAAAGYSGILGPVADHSCTTRNGRSMETKGESPYLTARYVERLVRGFQGTSLADPNTVAATLKHWIGYECADDGTDYRGAAISELELFETHVPPFEAGFRAGAAMYMPAFTQLDGIPMHMNRSANTRLRALLGGEHAVSIGDYTGDVELIEHGVAGDMCDAAFKAFQGGLDISLQGGTYIACLPHLVKDGQIAREDLESRVIEVLRLKERLGLYQDRLRYGRPAELQQIVLSQEHRAIARSLAREALVMLTKRADVPLPLRPSARILVTGPLAENRQAMMGEWSARGRPEDVVTPCAGMRRSLGQDKVDCVPIKAVDTIGVEELRAAVDAAARADVVLVMLGETRSMSGEAASRLYPGIPAAQYALVEALKQVGKPLIGIVVAGRALPVSRLAGKIPDLSDGVDVLFYTSQLGIEAGAAIADVLRGEQPPSGRLSISLPCESGIISETFRERRIGRPQQPVTRLVRDFRAWLNNSGKWVSHFQETFDREDCPIAFWFGYGLSYTDFTYSDFRLSAKQLRASDPNAVIEAAVTVTNDGRYRGTVVPQLYVRDTVAIPAPRRLELRGFRRIELKPGESARVAFKLTPADLATYALDPETNHLDLDKGRQPQPDKYPVMVFISDSADVSADTPQGSFVLTE